MRSNGDHIEYNWRPLLKIKLASSIIGSYNFGFSKIAPIFLYLTFCLQFLIFYTQSEMTIYQTLKVTFSWNAKNFNG